MKKILTLALAVLVTVGASAQSFIEKASQRHEIATVDFEVDNGLYETTMEIFTMENGDQKQYYLDAGTLGIGDDVIQFKFDPLYHLFIPIGSTYDEAKAKMDEILDWYKLPKGESMELQGCLAVGIPSDKPEDYETVKVTSTKFLLSKILEFSVPRGEYVRATHVSKGDFKSLIFSMKVYRKIHPKEI